jgi:hypothetical protein
VRAPTRRSPSPGSPRAIPAAVPAARPTPGSTGNSSRASASIGTCVASVVKFRARTTNFAARFLPQCASTRRKPDTLARTTCTTRQTRLARRPDNRDAEREAPRAFHAPPAIPLHEGRRGQRLELRRLRRLPRRRRVTRRLRFGSESRPSRPPSLVRVGGGEGQARWWPFARASSECMGWPHREQGAPGVGVSFIKGSPVSCSVAPHPFAACNHAKTRVWPVNPRPTLPYLPGGGSRAAGRGSAV